MACMNLVYIQGKQLACLWSVKCLGLSKTLKLEYSQTPELQINVKLCPMVLLIELYLVIFQGHWSVKQL